MKTARPNLPSAWWLSLLLMGAAFADSEPNTKLRPYVLGPGEGVETERGFGAELKATPRTAGGQLLTVTNKPSGFRTPIVRHPRDMSFYVLEGELSVHFEGETHVLGPGAFAQIPGGTPLAFSSTGAGGATWLHVMVPGEGQVEFWEAQRRIGETIPAGDARMAAMIASAAEFGIEYVAPSPF